MAAGRAAAGRAAAGRAAAGGPCSGSGSFLRVAPDDVPHMMTEGYDASRAGYDLSSAFAKECFAHTTVMSAGDLEYGVQNVEEEFSIAPDTGGKVIYVAASFDIGWSGTPLRLTSIYRYEFDEDGLIAAWDAHYDPIMTYDALRARPSSGTSGTLGMLAAGALAGGAAVICVVVLLMAIGKLKLCPCEGASPPASSREEVRRSSEAASSSRTRVNPKTGYLEVML